jgi:hypothetical protein
MDEEIAMTNFTVVSAKYQPKSTTSSPYAYPKVNAAHSSAKPYSKNCNNPTPRQTLLI